MEKTGSGESDSGAQAGVLGELAALGKNSARCGYNSRDCPVHTGLSGELVASTPTVGRAISGRHVDFTNDRKVTPDYPVCHEGRGCNGRLCQKRKNIAHCSLSGGAPDCPVRPWTEGNYGLPNGAPMTLSCLGAIKGTPMRMEQYTKHPLNILRRRDFAYTHPVHCDRDSSTSLSCKPTVLLSCARSCLVCVLLLQLSLLCVLLFLLTLMFILDHLCKA